MALVTCPDCGKQISSTATACPNCGRPMAIRCPKCGSDNVKVISGASKVTSVVLWGPLAANKVMSKYACKNCGHKF